MQADPVAVGVCDEAQARVGGGVVQVTQQVDRLRASFRAQKSVELLRADHLIRRVLGDGGADRQTDRRESEYVQINM